MLLPYAYRQAPLDDVAAEAQQHVRIYAVAYIARTTSPIGADLVRTCRQVLPAAATWPRVAVRGCALTAHACRRNMSGRGLSGIITRSVLRVSYVSSWPVSGLCLCCTSSQRWRSRARVRPIGAGPELLTVFRSRFAPDTRRRGRAEAYRRTGSERARPGRSSLPRRRRFDAGAASRSVVLATRGSLELPWARRSREANVPARAVGRRIRI
ncbi:uncharacterized protein V1510DRAFT_418719 [Dipodascopsis tothii]|uniref:uncharacterized protein n=1 Tax=Dipodascopsis tothii TaxID=44089 RepID=UPI0034CE444B